MREIKRKNKKVFRKRVITFFILLSFFAVTLGGGSAYWYYLSSKPLYISPLAKGFVISTVSNDKDLDSIKKSLKKQKIEYQTVVESNEKYIIGLKDKSQIILSANKDINIQLSSLQFILARLTMEGKLFTQLDLRFDKPVIRLK